MVPNLSFLAEWSLTYPFSSLQPLQHHSPIVSQPPSAAPSPLSKPPTQSPSATPNPPASAPGPAPRSTSSTPSPSPAAVNTQPSPPPSTSSPSPSVAVPPSSDVSPQPAANGAVLNRLGFASVVAGFVAVALVA
ncbi:classical arabinogalactan protein 9-like [Abeliophyllum distichum]|uniref:Classical arabinogalactan protein 9-like n=1 Tax=Abeliophyllum distichum TaxID=126358 RepID=A0ABD1PRT6_9LAMI